MSRASLWHLLCIVLFVLYLEGVMRISDSILFVELLQVQRMQNVKKISEL